MKLVTLTQETKKDLLNHLLKRSPNNYGAFEERVQAIIQEVRAKGDEALFAYTKQFDKVELTAETIRVTPEEIEEAYRDGGAVSFGCHPQITCQHSQLS